MNWDDLRVIAALRHHDSFAQAGEALHMDATTVARRLSRIERTLGYKLFVAVDGGRKPTQECEAILANIAEIETNIKKIETLRAPSALPAGKIRIAATSSIAEAILAPTLPGFMSANPGITVSLKTADENTSLARWETDLAVRLGKPVKGEFIIRKLAELRLYMFRPSTLHGKSPIVCGYPDELAATPEMHMLQDHADGKPMRVITSNIRVIKSMISSHRGIGILPEHIAGDLFEDEGLSFELLNARREAWLLIQGHLADDPATRLVVDWIVNAFARYR
jgi:DNA-binding transcriptional LysR family regulator